MSSTKRIRENRDNITRSDGGIGEEGSLPQSSPNRSRGSRPRRSGNSSSEMASDGSKDCAEEVINNRSVKTRVTEDGDARWEGMVQGLLDYYRKHQNFNVPRDYKWNNKNLYEFVRNQRKHYLNGLRGKTPALLPRRAKRLQEIGFELDPTGAQGQNDAIDDKRWVTMFDGLVEFHRRHGSFAVPIGYMCDNRSLHDWIRHNRKQYSTLVNGKPALSAARIDRLLSIGFDLDPTGRRQDRRSDQERWDIMFRGLQEYYDRYGTFVIQEGTMYDNRNLASWAHNQRRLYANYLRHQHPTLLPDRVEKLQSIGFVLSPRYSSDRMSKYDTMKRHANEGQETRDRQSNRIHIKKRRPAADIPETRSGRKLLSSSYEYCVTTAAERAAVSKVDMSIAIEALSLFQAMTELDRIQYTYKN